jgi:hypothetical protein
MQKQLQTLLSREMTRQEFLATIGVGVASVMGLSGLLRVLSGKPNASQQHQGYGYGRSTYGGGVEA